MLQNIKFKSTIKWASWQQPLSSPWKLQKSAIKSCTNRSQKLRVFHNIWHTCMCALSNFISGAKKERLDYASGHKGWNSHAHEFHQRQGPVQLYLTLLLHHRTAWAHTLRKFHALWWACILLYASSTHTRPKVFWCALDLLPFIESGLVPEPILCAQVKGRKSFTCFSRWKLRFHVELDARLCAHI